MPTNQLELFISLDTLTLFFSMVLDALLPSLAITPMFVLVGMYVIFFYKQIDFIKKEKRVQDVSNLRPITVLMHN